MRDLTKTPGNPSSHLNDSYARLMKIECVNELKTEALVLVGKGGISEANTRKFRLTLQSKNTLTDVRFYLTNFVLAGAGLAVGAGRR